jgi:hypothetical protein
MLTALWWIPPASLPSSLRLGRPRLLASKRAVSRAPLPRECKSSSHGSSQASLTARTIAVHPSVSPTPDGTRFVGRGRPAIACASLPQIPHRRQAKPCSSLVLSSPFPTVLLPQLLVVPDEKPVGACVAILDRRIAKSSGANRLGVVSKDSSYITYYNDVSLIFRRDPLLPNPLSKNLSWRLCGPGRRLVRHSLGDGGSLGAVCLA